MNDTLYQPATPTARLHFTARLFACLALIASFALAPPARATTSANAAHKFYASLAQLDYNEETKSFEIATRIFADDLELALTRRHGRAVYLDKTPDVANLVRAYLQERLEVRGRDGKLSELRWVGMEVQVDTVWVYVEAPLPQGTDGVSVRNRILLEQYDEQVNTTIIKVAGKQKDHAFRRGAEDWLTIS